MRDDCVNECLRIAQTVALECDLPSLSSTTTTVVRMSVNNDVRFYEVASYCWSHSSKMVAWVSREIGLNHLEILRMPVGKSLGSDEQCPHVAIANRLERLQFHRTVLFFIMAVCFFCYVLTGAVIIYIKKDVFSLSRACAEL